MGLGDRARPVMRGRYQLSVRSASWLGADGRLVLGSRTRRVAGRGEGAGIGGRRRLAATRVARTGTNQAIAERPATRRGYDVPKATTDIPMP